MKLSKPDLDAHMRRERRPLAQGRSDPSILGLAAFEKISAVEGVRLSDEMREDLRSLDKPRMDESQRSLFILRKYGRE